MTSVSQGNLELPEAIRRMLRERIERNLDLPLQSHTSSRVVALCNSSEGDARALADVIHKDPALAGHVLGIANSAAYGAKEQIVSLQQAVSRLGIEAVNEIAVAVSLKGKVFDVPGYATRVRELWIHSAATAVYAREIAAFLSKDYEGIFLCGLLHDVGKPVVIQNFVNLVREQTDRTVPPALMELAMDEFHEEVGAMVVAHWKFPEWMITVVGAHRDYSKLEELGTEARVVNLASKLAHWALDSGAEESEFDTEQVVIQELGLDFGDLSELLQMRPTVLEVADAFL